MDGLGKNKQKSIQTYANSVIHTENKHLALKFNGVQWNSMDPV
jgi:hypothetical protein